jgi:hypothetical protein
VQVFKGLWASASDNSCRSLRILNVQQYSAIACNCRCGYRLTGSACQAATLDYMQIPSVEFIWATPDSHIHARTHECTCKVTHAQIQNTRARALINTQTQTQAHTHTQPPESTSIWLWEALVCFVNPAVWFSAGHSIVILLAYLLDIFFRKIQASIIYQTFFWILRRIRNIEFNRKTMS